MRASHLASTRARGFTAIELMVTVAIMAILAALAAPSFSSLIESWRVREAVEELQNTIYFARSEAIKRGGKISIVQSGNSGWAVQFDTNGDGSSMATLQTTSTPARLSITFPATTLVLDRWGMLAQSGGSPAAMAFLIKPEGKNDTDNSARRLCTSAGGRIQQKTGADTC